MTAKKAEQKKDAAGKPLRLVLLDTHAILHRAYHAIPDFSSSKGEPTGALYGLVSTLLRIVADLKPDYIVATRDLPGATHRHEKFEAYKATRMKTDDALIVQLEQSPKVFEAFGIPLYDSPTFEADDILGTIVRQVSARGDIKTIIASGDMDTLQLVSPKVSVYTMRKGITDTILFDEDRVKERYGFGPEHVIDYKALRGDPSDNIPGVKGIGEKGATELIEKFGTIEELYKALEKNPAALSKKGIKPRTIELLKAQKAEALFSKELATISTDAPIVFELPKRQWHIEDHVRTIAEYCDEMEFRSLKERVLAKSGAGKSSESSEAVEASAASNVDPMSFKETSVALWLLRSDFANPSEEDILDFAHTTDFGKAREAIFKQLRETGKLASVYEEIERPLIPVIERMNETGIALDTAYLKKLAREYSKGLAEISKRIYQRAGHEFNIGSPKQLGVVLYDELKIAGIGRQKKTAGGARTTREDELIKLADQNPIIGDVLAYRELTKLLSTYIEKMPALVGKDGRIHAEFLQAGAATGRMASQNPNLQNIPIKTEYGRRIREGFVAAPGYVLAAIDYSQIELRIAAGLSGDEKLTDIFKHGGDVHAAAAAQVFGVPPEHVDKEMRRRAKVINFGILYGMGVNALRGNLGDGVSREEAADFLDDYFRNFAGLARYIERVKAEAARMGYTETLFGRRRYFSGFKSTLPGLRAQAERMAVNAPIQGTQADIIKLAMVKADALIEKEAWRAKAKLVLQVHDELVYEVAEKDAQKIVPILRKTMEDVVEPKVLSGVPIVAEASIGKNWGDMKKIDH